MFKIEDIDLEINSAAIEAFINDDENIMEWGIEINAHSINRDDIKWKVKLSAESLLKTKENQLSTWKDIAGLDFHWTEGIEDENEHALMYIFQHEPIYNSKGIFYLNDEGKVCIKWNGKCDIYWNTNYDKGLDFIIDTPVEFKGVWFGKEIEPICKKSLSAYITHDSFNYVTERNVSLLKPTQKN